MIAEMSLERTFVVTNDAEAKLAPISGAGGEAPVARADFAS